ncbi:hypothetical protein LCGC14_0420580 [marine sediment metagenome]|uniref:Uncharacterized protein n=1 Tax=marine sediment metagenome TaxID=412755 RepID=A0A0F9SX55_9ZZZZ
MNRPRYTKEEIKEGCKGCHHSLEDSRRQNGPWCMFGKRPFSNPVRGTHNCVFWNNPKGVSK